MADDLMEPRRCSAKSKQSGERCKRAPIVGGTVCVMHGGKAPAVQAAAEARVVEAAAVKVLSKVWDPQAKPVTNAVAAMQKLAGQTEQAADVLGSRIGSGEPACEECGRGDLAMNSAEAVAWLRVLREHRQLLEAMERLGIAERYLQFEEAQASQIVAAATGAIAEIGLSPEDRERFLGMFLELLAPGPTVPGEVAS